MKRSTWTIHHWVLVALILMGTGLRLHLLGQDIRFQPDEALFAAFARAAALNGDWLLSGALDKPPVTLYASAWAQILVGDNELAARLPSTFASILMLPVMAVLARSLYPKDRAVPVLTLALTALSPFAIAFSAVAYTDGPMLFFGFLGLLLAVRGRWGWSGLWLGLAFASKIQGLFYLPLPLVIGWLTHRLTSQHARRFGLTFGVSLALVIVWDLLRPETSVFTLALVNNNPHRLIRANELLPRLADWFYFGQALLEPLTALLVPAAVVAVLVGGWRAPRQRTTIHDLLLLAFLLTYFLLHWLVAFNTFDRYQLLALPPLILLAARALSLIGRTRWVMLLLVVLMFSPALAASEGRSRINAESFAGIEDLAAYLNAQPVATVIYDYWLSWELRYYLGQWHDKRLTYYPTPASLVRDALALCEIGPRYFPAPAQKPVGPWLEALRSAGFTVETAYTSPAFVAYRLQPPWTDLAECD